MRQEDWVLKLRPVGEMTEKMQARRLLKTSLKDTGKSQQ